jgi:hypothetical protein
MNLMFTGGYMRRNLRTQLGRLDGNADRQKDTFLKSVGSLVTTV